MFPINSPSCCRQLSDSALDQPERRALLSAWQCLCCSCSQWSLPLAWNFTKHNTLLGSCWWLRCSGCGACNCCSHHPSPSSNLLFSVNPSGKSISTVLKCIQLHNNPTLCDLKSTTKAQMLNIWSLLAAFQCGPGCQPLRHWPAVLFPWPAVL